MMRSTLRALVERLRRNEPVGRRAANRSDCRGLGPAILSRVGHANLPFLARSSFRLCIVSMRRCSVAVKLAPLLVMLRLAPSGGAADVAAEEDASTSAPSALGRDFFFFLMPPPLSLSPPPSTLA